MLELDTCCFEKRAAMSKKPKANITFSSLPRHASLNDNSRLKISWQRSPLRQRIGYALSLICEGPVSCHIEFVDALQMATLNWQFRGLDHPTDVLSFPPHPSAQDAHEDTNRDALGELAVCIDVCVKQAKKHKVSVSQEIEKMILHGLIHLKGFDHERSDAAHAVMSGLERSLSKELIKQFGAPDFCLLSDAQKSPKQNVRGKL
jgi:rRNA maturation RNase YbeY